MGFSKVVRFKEEKRSRIVLALDPIGIAHEKVIEWSYKILKELEGIVSGVKIGLPLILRVGLNHVGNIIDEFKDSYFWIADLKLADVAHILTDIAEMLHNIGFDAVISHLFTGREGSLNELSEKCKELDLGLLGVLVMSHKGANDLFSKTYEDLLSIALDVDVDGFILPATMPFYIRRTREVIGWSKIIFAPGVGAQGASPGDAIRNGADFEIIGRAITFSENPKITTLKIAKIHEEVLGSCTGK